jgi:hypothetical protein
MEPASSKTLNTLEELQDAALELVQATRRQLTLFTPDMEAAIYNRDDMASAFVEIIKRSRHTSIRILTRDTRPAIEQEHRLLKLFRYSDTQFQIKTLTLEKELKSAAYLIGDDYYMLRRQRADDYRALCYTGDRARTKVQLEEFEQLWKFAAPDPALRSFLI